MVHLTYTVDRKYKQNTIYHRMFLPTLMVLRGEHYPTFKLTQPRMYALLDIVNDNGSMVTKLL